MNTESNNRTFGNANLNAITAKVLADSIGDEHETLTDGARITTFEITVHRMIWSEFMTHRVFSRNAASSRAVPVKKVIEMILNNFDYPPAYTPISFGLNQRGMTANKEIDIENLGNVIHEWTSAAHSACHFAKTLNDKYNIHKQVVNRLLEPFTIMKAVVTATELNNFFHLRNHENADPHIRQLAKVMLESRSNSTPRKLRSNEWHMPYIDGGYWSEQHTNDLSLEDALKVSASCCAQVSYRVLDDSLEKAYNICDKLLDTYAVHASPFEHQAKPVCIDDVYIYRKGSDDAVCGITHTDRRDHFWSGNFRGWIQYRQLIKNHTVFG
jgi:thymidylate synthase ThyX